MNISGNMRFSNSPVFINAVKNITDSKSWGANGGFNITVKQKLTFNISGSISQTFTEYSIQVDRNQTYMNYSANASVKWQVFKKTYLEANYRFSNYSNKKLNFSQPIHTLNVSVRQLLGKTNRFELRLAAIDLLNQNKDIYQSAGTNYIQFSQNPTLARYFLLTFSYNLRGFDTNNNRRIFF
jgi:hypothetical protein